MAAAGREQQKDGREDGGFDRGGRAGGAEKIFHLTPHGASLNVPLVIELPPPVVPGKQPFWNVGVPASSRYLDTSPKQVPCTMPLPEKLSVCLGRYSVPDRVRQV